MENEIINKLSNIDGELITAICAVFISAISLIVTAFSLYAQRKHNRLSVRPIVEITHGDYIDNIFVNLNNYGFGPMEIIKFEVIKENQRYTTLVDSLGDIASHITWNTFTVPLDNKILASNDNYMLLKGIFNDNQINIKNAIRRSLAITEIRIRYRDVYGQDQPVKVKKLDWFGR